MRHRSFGRRALLKVAGASLLVPRFLQTAFADESERGVRLCILMQGCGTHQASFWPDAAGSSPILHPILDDPALRAKSLFVRGIENVTTGLGNEHDRGFHSLWTGVAPVGTPEDSFGGGPSIDQQLRRALVPNVMFPTLNCGVLAAGVPKKNGHRASFSYIGARQQVPTQTDPRRLYAALFPVQGSSEQVVQRLLARRSALDHAARDLTSLSLRLGPYERRKLDAHMSALREYEQRLSHALTPGASTCAVPAAPAASDPKREDDVPLLADLMLGLVSLALGCNLTRIVTFQFGPCGNQWRYRWLNMDEDSHELAHSDNPSQSTPQIADKMTQISRWTASVVARFAKSLDALPEADGTVLDRSLVIWANENGTGHHTLNDLPIVLLGRADGRLSGSGLVDVGRRPHHELGTSVLRLMGVDAAGFGDRPGCGPLPQIG